MNPRLFIPLCLAGAVALACGSRSRSEASVVPPSSVVTMATALPTPKPVRRVEKQSPAQVKTAFAVSAAPNALHFALNVTNGGHKTIELEFPSGQQYDFAVIDSSGKEVYRWGKGRMFTQSLQNKVIDGGQTMRFEERASTALPHGSYVAVATLRSSNYPVQERVEFELR